MAAEFGKDELLAQAILDLELKMKHEIRQNNAYLLSKIEKHYEQTDKKLTFLEAKMEAMCREREDRHHSHNRGGRRTNYFATNNFAQNNPIGRAYGVDGGGRRPPGPPVVLPPSMPNQVQQQQHPYKVFGAGGSGGGGSGGGGGNNATATNRHQFKQNIEKQPVGDGHGHGGRYKQTLGTSKAQVASPSTWTTKAAGLYTDDENESDTSVESRKSDAKHLAPPTQPPQNELVVAVEDKGQNDGNDADNNDEQKPQQQEIVEEVAAGDDVVVTAVEGEDANGEKVVVEKLETREEMTGSSDSQPKPTVEIRTVEMHTVEMRKESTDNESLTAACTSAVAMMLNIKENHPSMSTVTPGATISPVIGGFGRRRK
ncbi:hypothetical protein niasHT_017866 [Heterodera trifolii]|uniref:Uncharacterized protein n=1 Tax=Heterodera trifolii TaxID=157864 RepID=A0ABD2LFD4_9BILA